VKHQGAQQENGNNNSRSSRANGNRRSSHGSWKSFAPSLLQPSSPSSTHERLREESNERQGERDRSNQRPLQRRQTAPRDNEAGCVPS
jgi:hypothetical protein